MTVTLFTYAAVPAGIFFWTDFEVKFSTVTVVLTLRKELWIVYLGVKGDATRSWVVEGTVK